MQSHIRKVHEYLAVTCHWHFWQNDRGLLRATAVTRGWNGYRNKSQQRKLALEKKILPPLQQGFELTTFWSRALGSLITIMQNTSYIVPSIKVIFSNRTLKQHVATWEGVLTNACRMKMAQKRRGQNDVSEKPLTPSLPQPVKFPGWNMDGRACKQDISGPITYRLSMLCLLMEILSHASAEKQNKTKRLKGFKFCTFNARFQVTPPQWKG